MAGKLGTGPQESDGFPTAPIPRGAAPGPKAALAGLVPLGTNLPCHRPSEPLAPPPGTHAAWRQQTCSGRAAPASRSFQSHPPETRGGEGSRQTSGASKPGGQPPGPGRGAREETARCQAHLEGGGKLPPFPPYPHTQPENNATARTLRQVPGRAELASTTEPAPAAARGGPAAVTRAGFFLRGARNSDFRAKLWFLKTGN